MIVASEGIDISDAQSPASLDWARVRAEGITWGYVKILEGTTLLDHAYAEHVRRCRAASDILLAGYCYHHPSGTVRESALRFCDLVAPLSLELPPVLDLETRCGARPTKLKPSADAGCYDKSHPKASPQQTVDSCLLWLDTVSSQLRKPLLYWGSGLAGELRKAGADLSGLAEYDQILADYSGGLDLIPGQPDPVAHQWTDGGLQAGPVQYTAGLQLDRNRSRLTAAELAGLGRPAACVPPITLGEIHLSDPYAETGGMRPQRGDG